MDTATLRLVFWSAMAVLTFLALPVAIALSMRQFLTDKKRGGLSALRRNAGIGNALQELDRLVARPSVEFTVETETPILKREDHQGGE